MNNYKRLIIFTPEKTGSQTVWRMIRTIPEVLTHNNTLFDKKSKKFLREDFYRDVRIYTGHRCLKSVINGREDEWIKILIIRNPIDRVRSFFNNHISRMLSGPTNDYITKFFDASDMSWEHFLEHKDNLRESKYWKEEFDDLIEIGNGGVPVEFLPMNYKDQIFCLDQYYFYKDDEFKSSTDKIKFIENHFDYIIDIKNIYLLNDVIQKYIPEHSYNYPKENMSSDIKTFLEEQDLKEIAKKLKLKLTEEEEHLARNHINKLEFDFYDHMKASDKLVTINDRVKIKGKRLISKLHPDINPQTLIDKRGGIFTFYPNEHPICEWSYIITNVNSTRGFHYHKEFDEYILIISGSGIYVEKYADKLIPTYVSEGDCIFIPRFTPHIYYPATDTKKIAMITKKWNECTEPITKI